MDFFGYLFLNVNVECNNLSGTIKLCSEKSVFSNMGYFTIIVGNVHFAKLTQIFTVKLIEISFLSII